MATTSSGAGVHRILCPTDFSDFGTAAGSYAAALAAAYGASLRLVHVLTPFAAVAPEVNVPGVADAFETQNRAARERLAAEARRLGRAEAVVDTETREGQPVHEILQAASSFRADLLVLGTHGRGGFERLVLGSVTEKLLRKAPCPVLTVPRGALGREPGQVGWTHLLSAHDGSAASQAGVDHAVALAERTGARLTLMTVVEALPYGGDYHSPAHSALQHDRERQAVEVLDAALAPGVRQRVRVSERIVYGRPWQQILEVAAQDHPDVIVLGVQGRGALDLLMFGSTTNHLVRMAEQPVLTVRPRSAGA